jgi:hypothetical protein
MGALQQAEAGKASARLGNTGVTKTRVMDCQSLALTMAIMSHESKAGLTLLSFFMCGFATGCEANTKVFQAYDEGSIPFTRSILFKHLRHRHSVHQSDFRRSLAAQVLGTDVRPRCGPDCQ